MISTDTSNGDLLAPARLLSSPRVRVYSDRAWVVILEPAFTCDEWPPASDREPSRRTIMKLLQSLPLAVAFLSACGGGSVTPPPAQGMASGSDDTAAVQAAVDAGGVVTFPAGQYLLTKTVVVSKSNTVIQGVGPTTIFTFKPALPLSKCVNDRAFTTPCDVFFTPRRQITAPIAVGDSTFAASGDLSDLVTGDWLIVTERDQKFADIVAVDWAQVASVAGATVTTAAPFRTAFSSAQPFDLNISGLGFVKVPALVQGAEFRNLTVNVPQPGADIPAISIFAALDTTVDRVTAYSASGQALYSFLAKGVVIQNSSGSSGTTLNEFAATVDLQLINNVFSVTQSTGFGLDLASAFFTVSGNSVPVSQDIGMYLFIGIHDGIVENNQIAYVTSSGNALGLLARGTQNVTIINNYFAGGAGATSMGLAIGPDDNEAVPIVSAHNVIAPNMFGPDWWVDYDPANSP
jgi:hypothetical protein